MTLAEYLKLKRGAASDLAKRLGVSRQAIASLARSGRGGIRLRAAIALVKATGGVVTLEELAHGAPSSERDARRTKAATEGVAGAA